MLLKASDPEIFAVKVEVYFYFEMEEVLHNKKSPKRPFRGEISQSALQQAFFCTLFVAPRRTEVSDNLSFSVFRLSFALKKLSCFGF